MKLFKKAAQLILMTVLLAVLTPTLYFAWRIGQPLSLPQFNELTYLQFIEWRKISFERSAMDYQTQHPAKRVSLSMCEGLARGLSIVVVMPQSGLYTLAALSGVKPNSSYALPTDVNWLNFLPKWWKTFETIELYNVNHYKNGPAPYCRIQPNMPTKEELEVMIRMHSTIISESK